MQSTLVNIIDGFLSDPIKHKETILSFPFMDVNIDGVIFKGIQPIREGDEFSVKLERYFFPEYCVKYNFARLSPQGQLEPNFIHTDDDMGDITCLLYLNECPPENDGTSLYLEDDCDVASVVVKSKFNRLLIFDSAIRHSRNLFHNFGNNMDARLVQVAFLKRR